MATKRLISWLFAFVPLLITLFMLPLLPDTVPAHYGSGGNVTRFGSKYEMLILPAIAILMGFLSLLIEKNWAKKGEKGQQNIKVSYWIGISLSMLFTALQIWILHLAYSNAESIHSGNFSSMKIVSVSFSLFFIIIGNSIPKCKQNYLMGIRTPWTLKNEATWHKTHRFGGLMMVIFGIISALLCLFVLDGFTGLQFSIGGFLILVPVIMLYSRNIYKQETQK